MKLTTCVLAIALAAVCSFGSSFIVHSPVRGDTLYIQDVPIFTLDGTNVTWHVGGVQTGVVSTALQDVLNTGNTATGIPMILTNGLQVVEVVDGTHALDVTGIIRVEGSIYPKTPNSHQVGTVAAPFLSGRFIGGGSTLILNEVGIPVQWTGAGGQGTLGDAFAGVYAADIGATFKAYLGQAVRAAYFDDGPGGNTVTLADGVNAIGTTGEIEAQDGAFIAELCNGAQAGAFNDGVRTALLGDGTYAVYGLGGPSQFSIDGNNYVTFMDNTDDWGIYQATDSGYSNYFAGLTIFGATVVPETDSNIDFGASDKRWGTGWFDAVDVAGSTYYIESIPVMGFTTNADGSTNLTLYGNVITLADTNAPVTNSAVAITQADLDAWPGSGNLGTVGTVTSGTINTDIDVTGVDVTGTAAPTNNPVDGYFLAIDIDGANTNLVWTQISFAGYATETWTTNWVTNWIAGQGFLTSSDLAPYATTNWVTNHLQDLDHHIGFSASNQFDIGTAAKPVRTGYFHTVVVHTNTLISTDGTRLELHGGQVYVSGAGDTNPPPQGLLAGDAISLLSNDVGYITGYVETDPVYLAWFTNGWLSHTGNVSAHHVKYTDAEALAAVTNWTTNWVIGQAYLNTGDAGAWTNLSQYNNDAGFITGYNETDPIHLAWLTNGWQSHTGNASAHHVKYTDAEALGATTNWVTNWVAAQAFVPYTGASDNLTMGANDIRMGEDQAIRVGTTGVGWVFDNSQNRITTANTLQIVTILGSAPYLELDDTTASAYTTHIYNNANQFEIRHRNISGWNISAFKIDPDWNTIISGNDGSSTVPTAQFQSYSDGGPYMSMYTNTAAPTNSPAGTAVLFALADGMYAQDPDGNNKKLSRSEKAEVSVTEGATQGFTGVGGFETVTNWQENVADTGFTTDGSSITVVNAGRYTVEFDGSWSTASASDGHAHLYTNGATAKDTANNNVGWRRDISTGNDDGSAAGSRTLNLAAGTVCTWRWDFAADEIVTWDEATWRITKD